jgi:hypothetical protein
LQEELGLDSIGYVYKTALFLQACSEGDYITHVFRKRLNINTSIAWRSPEGGTVKWLKSTSDEWSSLSKVQVLRGDVIDC